MDEIEQSWIAVPANLVGGRNDIEVCLEIGKARNSETHKIYSGHKTPGGYIMLGFHLKNNNSLFNILEHRLIAIIGIPNPENKPFVNHKNKQRSDNRIENLEWVTEGENMQSDKKSFSKPQKVLYIEYPPDQEPTIHNKDDISSKNKAKISRSIRDGSTFKGSKWLIVGEETLKYVISYGLSLKPEDFKYTHPTNKNFKISESGLVLNTISSRIIITISSGYCVISAGPTGSHKMYRIHRLVYEAISGELIPSGYEIDHIDSNRLNNQYKNLRLVTHDKNMKNPNTRKNNKRSVPAHVYNLNGDLVFSGISIMQVMKDFFGIKHGQCTKRFINDEYVIVYEGESFGEVFNSLIFKYNLKTNKETYADNVRVNVDTGKPSLRGYIYYTGKGNHTKWIKDDQ